MKKMTDAWFYWDDEEGAWFYAPILTGEPCGPFETWAELLADWREFS
jgi:hypothetical protein